jgi:UDP-glucose 4-epimerase
VAPIIADCVNFEDARNQIFNLGADIPYTVLDLARLTADAMGCECKILHLPARNEVKIAFSDHGKAEHVFGAREKTTLADGIHRMAAWVKTHGARESSIFEEIEIPRNLPPSWASVTTKR